MPGFLADENIPPAVVDFLRSRNHEVKSVLDLGLKGGSDDAILAAARQQGLVLVTFDKHFANILQYPLNTHRGIIRLRIHPPIVQHIIYAFDNLLNRVDPASMEGTLIVLEREGFRVRRSSGD